MPHTYKAVQRENKSFQIVKDGIPCVCPKTVYPMPKQDALRNVSFELQRFGCNTECPFAEVLKVKEQSGNNEFEEKDVYDIGCEGMGKRIMLDEVVLYTPPEKKSPILRPE